MAIRDPSGKAILAQTNTKTVGHPAASTGLVGDAAPAEVFAVTDYDLVKNQVHLEESQVEALRILRLMGDVTGMRSSSGPIPGTQKLDSASGDTSGSKFAIFRPNAGEVWQLIALEFDMTGGTGNTTVITYLSDGSDTVKLYEVTTASTSLVISDDIDAPIWITYDVYLEGIWARTSGTSGAFSYVVARVR